MQAAAGARRIGSDRGVDLGALALRRVVGLRCGPQSGTAHRIGPTRAARRSRMPQERRTARHPCQPWSRVRTHRGGPGDALGKPTTRRAGDSLLSIGLRSEWMRSVLLRRRADGLLEVARVGHLRRAGITLGVVLMSVPVVLAVVAMLPALALAIPSLALGRARRAAAALEPPRGEEGWRCRSPWTPAVVMTLAVAGLTCQDHARPSITFVSAAGRCHHAPRRVELMHGPPGEVPGRG